jgi:hypothetical protein
MSEVHPRRPIGGRSRGGAGAATGRLAADWLGLTAAPTFAIMALLVGLRGGQMDMVCAAGASPLVGMAPMYLLMSAFHLAPWLRLISSRSSSGSGILPRA